MTDTKISSRTDGEATRAKILEAAGHIFAAKGYAETTNKAIAAEADVDLASINYHFGNRDKLYQRVLVEAHSQLISLSEITALAKSDLPSELKLRMLLEGVVRRSREEHKWQSRVFARELLSPSSHIQVLSVEAIEPKIEIFKGLISEITGIDMNDPALLRCLLSIGAPCLMMLVVGENLPSPIRNVMQMPEEELIDHLYGFTMAGLQSVMEKQKR
jgi:AcrR family transcriptional regulator